MRLLITITLLCLALGLNAQEVRNRIDADTQVEWPKETFTYSYSGRHYLQLDTWRTFRNADGPYGDHRFSQGAGTAADPGISRVRNGIPMTFDGRLISIGTNGYHNNAEAMDIEVDVSCFSSTDNSSSISVRWRKKFTYSSDNTAARLFEWEIGEEVKKGDEILVSMRKITGSGTTRYYFYNASLYLEK